MSCDVGEVTKRLNNEQSSVQSKFIMGGSPGVVNGEPVTQEKRKEGWRMWCDVGEATEGLENEM